MLSVSILSLCLWVFLLLFRGAYWRILFLPTTEARPCDRPSNVAVVIPARDEVATIATTLHSLFSQKIQGKLHIFLVDDHSTDGTAEAARQEAKRTNRLSLLTILNGKPLPNGWTGKLWAVRQGLDAAYQINPDFMLLTDADITHAPDNLHHLISHAQQENVDLTSLMVKLNCDIFAERALIPAFVYFFFMLYPQRWIAKPNARTAGAAGGCMLVRPSALKRIGGIDAIRNALIDDCSLAAAIKKTGGRVHLFATRTTTSSRRYTGFGEIWNMIARTAFTQLHYSFFLLLFTLLALALIFMAPPWAALYGHGWTHSVGLATWILMALSFQPVLRLYNQNGLWGFALPLIALFYASATIGSALRFWLGRGGQWKGRAQAP
ncbi:MAG: glycosyltransferase [Bdellovibrionales bacterium]